MRDSMLNLCRGNVAMLDKVPTILLATALKDINYLLQILISIKNNFIYTSWNNKHCFAIK